MNFLIANKGMTEDQALDAFMRLSTPETEALDKALDEIGTKITQINLQTPEGCSEFIKLQQQHIVVGKKKCSSSRASCLVKATKGSSSRLCAPALPLCIFSGGRSCFRLVSSPHDL